MSSIHSASQKGFAVHGTKIRFNFFLAVILKGATCNTPMGVGADLLQVSYSTVWLIQH